MAQVSGATVRAVRSEVATVEALESCPHTRVAVEAGEVSLAQAKEIVGAEAAAPGSEGALLDTARASGMAGLRHEARRVRLGAIDVEQLHAEQRRRRDVHHFRDEFGMVRVDMALPPEVGLPFVNRLDGITDRVRRAAKRRGRVESRAAHTADAFLAMLADSARRDGSGVASKRPLSAEVVFVIDVRAVARGHAEPGELCHIVGGGPVPVSVVRDALPGAFVKLVTHDGTKIDRVLHLGRKRIPAALRTALELGAPPVFDGVTCVEEGCDRRYGLEWDHVDPVANDGATSFDNLDPRCRPCHRAKTERDRAAGRLGNRRSRSGGRAPP